MRERRKYSITIAIFLSVILALTVALAVILYQVSYDANFGVQTDLGLELQDEFGTPLSSIEFGLCPRNGIVTLDLKLQNIGNNESTYTIIVMPYNTSEYGFKTDFPNGTTWTIGETKSFTLSLEDFSMDSAVSYSETFAFMIDDHFSEAYEDIELEASTIEYNLDTSDYLEFISETFNASVYEIGDIVEYQFTTKAINTSATIDSFSYNIELYEGLTWLRQLFSGMKDCIPDLQPQDTIAITHTFDTSLWDSGIYTLHIVYTGHNSEEILQTYEYTKASFDDSTFIDISGRGSTGFDSPNSASSAWIVLAYVTGSFPITIEYRIDVIYSNGSLALAICDWTTETFFAQGELPFESLHFNFNSPSEWDTYTIRYRLRD